MFNLENAIKEWLREFNKHHAYDEGYLQEMELHVRDQVEDLLTQGMNEEEAFSKTIQSFGHIPEIAAEELTNIERKPSIRKFLFRTMTLNYFKTASRLLIKHPVSSLINVMGLAVAIGMALVVYVFYDWDQSLDQFHEHKNSVYLTTFFVDREGKEEQYGISPLPIGEMMQHDFSQIEAMCRIIDGNVIVKVEDHVFNERIRFVDPSFLDVFTFPLASGLPESLVDPNNIILSQDMAVKYFGDKDPLGQNLLVKFTDTKTKLFKVSGVAMEFPEVHIIAFDFLVNFNNIRQARARLDLNDWTEMADATLIKVSDPSALSEIENGMSKYLKIQNAIEQDWAISDFEFVKLADLHFRAGSIRNSISHDYNGEARLGMPIIAIFMIIMASLNYINIAITSAVKRLNEIGLRKVMGANKRLIILQFLTENIVMTFLATLMGVVLSVSVFIPWMQRLSGDPLQFNPQDPWVWIFLVGVMFLTGIGSGIYPAFYIARFQAVQIFKGKVKFGNKNTATKVFLGLQLVITCAGITNAIIFMQNNHYQHQRSWGYEQEGVVFAMVPDSHAFEKLRSAMLQEPSVVLTSGSGHHLGANTANQVVQYNEAKYEVEQLEVDKDYFKTMGLLLKAGQTFNTQNYLPHLVVNETFVKSLMLTDPIGKVVKIASREMQIIGVVKDFHSRSFSYKIRPTIFTLAQPENRRFLALRAAEGETQTVYSKLKQHWVTLFPETPFNGKYQEDVWGLFFELLYSAERFYRVIALFTVLLASMGLYGLVNLNVEGRIKEFSIRKVMGASINDLTYNLGKQYFLLVLIALIVGIPFSYLMGQASLEMLYSYPMPMSITGVLVASILLVLVVGLVIMTQIRRLSNSNPVEGLMTE
jgi:hypothetical protein